MAKVSLESIVMSTNLEYREREKEKVGDTLTKLNEEKRQQRARAREKKQRRLFFCWKKAT